MREFIEAIVSFPTVVYTSLLGVVVLYWGFVVAGIADVDFFDPGAKLDGAAEAAFDGAHDGLGHDGAGGDLHHDGSHGDGGVDADHAHDGGARGSSGALALLGARGVPVTVALSLLILWGWLLSGLASWLVLPDAGHWSLRAAIGSAVGLGSLVAAAFLTRLSVRPLRNAFGTVPPVHKQSVVGMLCRITTTRVDERFGQGEVDDGGAGIIVQVRCREANALRRGSLALIFDHDEKADVFHVMPEEEKPI